MFYKNVGLIAEEQGKITAAVGRRLDDTAWAVLTVALRGRRRTDWTPDPNVCDKIFKIKHGLDLWHKAKKVAAKVISASKVKGCKDLLAWASAVRNHLWWCAKECNGSALTFKVTTLEANVDFPLHNCFSFSMLG